MLKPSYKTNGFFIVCLVNFQAHPEDGSGNLIRRSILSRLANLSEPKAKNTRYYDQYNELRLATMDLSSMDATVYCHLTVDLKVLPFQVPNRPLRGILICRPLPPI